MIVALWIALCAGSSLHGALPVLPVPPAGLGVPLDPQPMPRETLVGLYRVELGSLFQPDKADAILQAHALLEAYFAAPSLAQRRSIVKSIEALNVDPAIIGRLTRVRARWAALAPGVYYVNEKRGPFVVRYFLGVPKGYDRTKASPLVVKLALIDALLNQTPADAAAVTNLFNGSVSAELAKHPDAIVLMPLPDLANLYGPSTAGMNDVIQAMLHAADRVNIDPARVYLFGQSLSAFSAWNLALHYPTYFASFAAMSGGIRADWQRSRLINLANTLPVFWADADDKIVRPDLSRNVARSLKNLKIDAEFQETKGLGHTPSDAILDDRYARLRSRVRPLYPEQVWVESTRPESVFGRADWVQMWQPAAPGKDHIVSLRRGGFINIFDNAESIRATRTGNHIDLIADNVDSLRLFLNDQMIDTSRPISVTVNKKTKFEGKITPSAEEMLMDQLTLGRGWRYYTAVLDIDLVDRPATNPTTRPTTAPTTPTRRRGITIGPG